MSAMSPPLTPRTASQALQEEDDFSSFTPIGDLASDSERELESVSIDLDSPIDSDIATPVALIYQRAITSLIAVDNWVKLLRFIPPLQKILGKNRRQYRFSGSRKNSQRNYPLAQLLTPQAQKSSDMSKTLS